MKPFCRPLYCAHDWVGKVVSEGDHVVDATAGNGHDSLFLAGFVGRAGQVDVFDIQQEALDSTRKRLESASCLHAGVRFHLMSHAAVGSVVQGPVKAVMFNLGYLPGGDKNIISQSGDTCRALGAATGLLAKGGILTVVCYPGHEGGGEEALAVERLLSSLPHDEWQVSKLAPLNYISGTSPLLIAALKF